MNNVISFTAVEAIETIIWICGSIITVAGATAIIVKAVHRAKEPDRKLEARISMLEQVAEKHVSFLDNDKRRLDSLEESNRVVMKALFALLSHGIDGNDVDAMRESKAEIYNYLINK